ncbi:MAG: hypothetical protein ACI4TW_04020 [Prevotella sp.]
MTIKDIKIKAMLYMMLSVTAFSATGCSDDDDYTRADEPQTSGEGIYFSGSNTSEFIRTDEDAPEVSFKVVRDNTAGALTVPLEVTKRSDNIVDIPSTVTFADGESEATVTVTYKSLDTAPTCELRIPEAYTNPYKIKNGSTVYAFKVYKLIMVSSRVTYKPDSESTPDYFSGSTSQLLQYSGENKFIWRNFLGSGIDLKFKIDGVFDANNVRNSHGEIIPLDHFIDDPEGDGWFLATTNNGNLSYATWTPEGSEKSISQYMFFWYEYQDYDYNTIDLRENQGSNGSYGYAYFNSPGIDDYANYVSFWAYIYY